MASFDEKSNRVHFTFLDNGFGIPLTIRRRFGEKIRRLLGAEVRDGDLIKSALKGEFRTRTRAVYRGKGLPQIFQTAQSKKIENLILLSKKGYVDCCPMLETKELNVSLYGTLLSWDIM